MLAPFDRISICRNEEAKMRRRMLRALPNEHIEAIWGTVQGSILQICIFMPLDYTATPNSIHCEHEEYDHHEDEAILEGLEYLGTIHSHPDRDEIIFSECDLRDSQELGDTLMAICAIEFPTEGKKRRKCRVAYWPTVRPLKVEYSYWEKF